VAPPTTRVTCSYTFEAAHRLPWHPGRCRDLHGHSYRLEVTLAGPLDEHGVVVDFDEVNDVVEREVLARFDHRDLNQILDNPTAELIAHRVWELLEDAGLSLEGLRLWETSDASVELTASPLGGP
jgi:6-pyruvoyltetrahydropterin/6-carboxytetrahydropterin synthase